MGGEAKSLCSTTASAPQLWGKVTATLARFMHNNARKRRSCVKPEAAEDIYNTTMPVNRGRGVRFNWGRCIPERASVTSGLLHWGTGLVTQGKVSKIKISFLSKWGRLLFWCSSWCVIIREGTSWVNSGWRVRTGRNTHAITELLKMYHKFSHR